MYGWSKCGWCMWFSVSVLDCSRLPAPTFKGVGNVLSWAGGWVLMVVGQNITPLRWVCVSYLWHWLWNRSGRSYVGPAVGDDVCVFFDNDMPWRGDRLGTRMRPGLILSWRCCPLRWLPVYLCGWVGVWIMCACVCVMCESVRVCERLCDGRTDRRMSNDAGWWLDEKNNRLVFANFCRRLRPSTTTRKKNIAHD